MHLVVLGDARGVRSRIPPVGQRSLDGAGHAIAAVQGTSTGSTKDMRKLERNGKYAEIFEKDRILKTELFVCVSYIRLVLWYIYGVRSQKDAFTQIFSIN